MSKEPDKMEIRIPFMMTKEESEAFDKARAKVYPLVTRAAVIRELIKEFVKRNK